MKKEWQKPELEILDVNMTLLGKSGEYTDNDFDAGTAFSDLTFS